MEELLERLEKAQEVVDLIREELYNTEDGYFYKVKIFVHNQVYDKEFLNLKIASETCNHYIGDNGFTELTTDNPAALKLHDGDGCTVFIIEKTETE